MRLRVALAVLLAFLLFAGRADAAPGLGDLEKRVLELYAKKDTEALERLVRGRQIDAWLLVEALFEHGHADVAEAVANARAWGALRDYARWRKDHAPRPQVLEALAEIAKPEVDQEAWLKKYGPLAQDEDRGVRFVRFLGRVAQSLNRLRRLDESIAMYERTAKEAEALGWFASAIRMLGYAANVARAAKKPDLAMRLIEQRVRAAQESGLQEVYFLALRQSAYILKRMGRLREARGFAWTSVVISEGLLQERISLRGLILIELDLGETHSVVRLLPRLRELEVKSGPDHLLHVAQVDLQLATAEATLGQFKHVLRRVSAAMEIYEKHAGPRDRYVGHIAAAKISILMRDPARALEHVAEARKAVNGARGVNDLTLEATALAYMGRTEDAIPLFQEALPLVPSEEVDKVVAAKNNIAHLLAYAGRPSEAEPYLAEARKLLDDVPDQSIHVHVHATASIVHANKGDWDLAIQAATKARDINGELLDRQNGAVNEVTLARAWLGKGDAARAMVHASNALHFVLERSAALPARLGAQYRSSLKELVEIALLAALRAGDREKFFEFAERAAAVALRNRLAPQEMVLHAFPPALRERELALQEEETRAVGAYRAAVRQRDNAARKTALERLDEVRAKLDRHRERLRAEQIAASQFVDPEVDSLASTQARLAPDEALLMFVQTVENVFAFRVTRDASRAWNLGTRDQVNALIDDLLLEDADTPPDEAVATLRVRVAKPLALSKDLKRLTVVPTGRLAHLPFSAIWPDRSIRLVASATIDRLLRERDPSPGKGVLAIGDPDSADGRRLPGAREEAKAVGDVILLGTDATEARIEQTIAKRARWRAVHVACHALIDPENPLRSALSLTPAGKRDGLWTVSEILQSNVATDLVVLGACSTGRGKTFDQEGALGFVQAFFVAGAKRVLVSLWDVDDKATSALLKRFHVEWGKPGTSPARALLRAQAWMRSQPQWAHPAYWAAWQLWGPE